MAIHWLCGEDHEVDVDSQEKIAHCPMLLELCSELKISAPSTARRAAMASKAVSLLCVQWDTMQKCATSLLDKLEKIGRLK